VLARPPSPMGITMFGMKPGSSSLMTGMAFILPPMPAVIRYQRPSSRLKLNMYDCLSTSNLNSYLQFRGARFCGAGLKPRGSYLVPKGTWSFIHAYPALKRWAMIFRPASGTRSCVTRTPMQTRNPFLLAQLVSRGACAPVPKHYSDPSTRSRLQAARSG
jgi:hypothetical protein